MTLLCFSSQALQGYNCTVFAYGQTGTGKTFTLEGDLGSSRGHAKGRGKSMRAGIIPRAIYVVFDALKAQAEVKQPCTCLAVLLLSTSLARFGVHTKTDLLCKGLPLGNLQ